MTHIAPLHRCHVRPSFLSAFMDRRYLCFHQDFGPFFAPRCLWYLLNCIYLFCLFCSCMWLYCSDIDCCVWIFGYFVWSLSLYFCMCITDYSSPVTDAQNIYRVIWRPAGERGGSRLSCYDMYLGHLVTPGCCRPRLTCLSVIWWLWVYKAPR